MSTAEYEAQNQNTLRRVEKNGDDWAAMGRVVPLVSSKITIKNNMGFNRDEPCDIPCHYTTGKGSVDATVYELRGRRAPPSGISVYANGRRTLLPNRYYRLDCRNTYRWSSPI